MTREAVHFTITEAHPYHGPNDSIAYREQCPKCRDERADTVPMFPATVICAECDGRGCVECHDTGEVVAP